MSETISAKMVRRSVVIALGIICIILAVSLVGAFEYYIPMINNKDKTIAAKDSTIYLRDAMLSTADSQIFQLNSNVTSLQNQVISYNSTIHNDSITIMNDNDTINKLANQVNQLTFMLTHNSSVLVSNQTVDIFTGKWGIFVLWNHTFTETGYVGVQVSGSPSTYVNFEYSLDGENFDNYRVDIGTGSIAVFPISATTYLYIYVGTWDDSTPTVAIRVTYYYQNPLSFPV